MKPSEILIAARAVIEKPEHWTQGAFARDAEDTILNNGYDDGAVCFCSLGAIEKVTESGSFLSEARDFLYLSMGSVVGYNDNHTHAEVLAKFDEAIALAQKEGA